MFDTPEKAGQGECCCKACGWDGVILAFFSICDSWTDKRVMSCLNKNKKNTSKSLPKITDRCFSSREVPSLAERKSIYGSVGHIFCSLHERSKSLVDSETWWFRCLCSFSSSLFILFFHLHRLFLLFLGRVFFPYQDCVSAMVISFVEQPLSL